MKVDELFTRAKDSLDAKMVYTEPVEQDGTTVIAAARIAAGGGAGTGQDEHGQKGEGGGLGLTARPVGAYVLKDGNLRWQPAIDVNRLIAVIGVVAVAALFVVGRIVRARSDA
jgi:uncharacterized spore protein YtfJ